MVSEAPKEAATRDDHGVSVTWGDLLAQLWNLARLQLLALVDEQLPTAEDTKTAAVQGEPTGNVQSEWVRAQAVTAPGGAHQQTCRPTGAVKQGKWQMFLLTWLNYLIETVGWHVLLCTWVPSLVNVTPDFGIFF